MQAVMNENTILNVAVGGDGSVAPVEKTGQPGRFPCHTAMNEKIVFRVIAMTDLVAILCVIAVKLVFSVSLRAKRSNLKGKSPGNLGNRLPRPFQGLATLIATRGSIRRPLGQ